MDEPCRTLPSRHGAVGPRACRRVSRRFTIGPAATARRAWARTKSRWIRTAPKRRATTAAGQTTDHGGSGSGPINLSGTKVSGNSGPGPLRHPRAGALPLDEPSLLPLRPDSSALGLGFFDCLLRRSRARARLGEHGIQYPGSEDLIDRGIDVP